MSDDGLRALRSAGTEAIGAFYDDWAASYDRDLDSYGYGAPQWVAARVAEAVAAPDARILDAGCGTGLVGEALQAHGYQHLTGIDLSPQSLAIARRKSCYETVQTQDLLKPLAFADDSFDAIVCVGTLTYIRQPRPLMAEFCRVGKPGAIVVFTQANDYYDTDFAALLQQLEDDGRWQQRAHTGPHAYLPRHPDYGDVVELYIDTFEVGA